MGTLAYGDAWNLFDNIVVSENLVYAKPGELRLVQGSRDRSTTAISSSVTI